MVDEDDDMKSTAEQFQLCTSNVFHGESKNLASSKVGFTLDNLPCSKWIDLLQEFHAWMTIRNLIVTSSFEILTEFTTHFARILKDWWVSLEKNDKIIFLTRQDFTEAIEILHLVFLGNI